MSAPVDPTPPILAGSTPEYVGIIGIGLMGIALAERLLAGGFRVVGWDMNPAQRDRLHGLGASAASNAHEVIARCQRILLSLPDLNVVETVFEEAGSALRAGQTLIDTTTGDPEQSTAVGKRLAELGVAYLDATVSGSSAQLRNADVILLVGGAKSAFDQCQDLFRLFSKRNLHIGPCGSGSKMKLVTNLVLGLNRAALAEGLSFAASLDLDAEQTLTALMESMAYSRIMDTKGRKMIEGNFEPQARLAQHLKDVRLILEAGAARGLNLPLSAAHRQLLESAESRGFGQADNSAIIRAYDKIPNPDLRK